MTTHEECEAKMGMELKPTLDSESDSDITLSGIVRKTLEARGRRRCSRRKIIPSDEEEKDNHKKDVTTVITAEVDLRDRTEPVTKAAGDMEKHTQHFSTPITPTKKRTASEAYPSPPPTKKTIRISLSPDGNNKVKVMTVEHKPSEMKRNNKPRPIVLSKRNNVDNVYPVHYETLTPQELWEEKHFDLSSPRLVQPLPLRYKLVEEKSPLTGGLYDLVLIPEMPADNIKKDLFIHPKHTNIRWVGEWAERKLTKEIGMYERVKKFWLFNYGYAYCPSWDCKHEFVAMEFSEEMQRPWVVAWLAELIGRRDVYMILGHLEWRMTKELERMEKGEKEEREEEDELEG